MHPSLNKGDTSSEEELLALQREFLQSKQTPSAKVKRVSRPKPPNQFEEQAASIEKPLRDLERLSLLDDIEELKPKSKVKVPKSAPREKKSLFAKHREAALKSENEGAINISDVIRQSTAALEDEESADLTSSQESALGDRDTMSSRMGEISHTSDRFLDNTSSRDTIEVRGALLKKSNHSFVERSLTEKGSCHEPSLPSSSSDYSEAPREEKRFTGLLDGYTTGELGSLMRESEKLQWMSDDAPAPISKNTSRFNFDGIPLGENSDIPTYHGLHHHGMDPEKPGYTIEELLMLCHSSVPQQRAMALNIFIKIFQNIREGLLSVETCKAIRRNFMKLGGALTLRMNLDHSSPIVLMTCIQAFHAWIVGPSLVSCFSLAPSIEERTVSTLSSLHGGHKSISGAALCDSRLSEADAGEDETSMEYFSKLVAYDSLAGLVILNIVPRLGVLLENPQIPHVYHAYMLDILLRLARHSIWASSEFKRNPKVFEAISLRYFQVDWPPVGQMEPTGPTAPLPNPIAIRLLTAVCQASFEFARQLLKSNIFRMLDRFLKVDVDSLPLDLQALGIQLQAEVLQLGRVLAFYNHSEEFVVQVPSIQNMVSLHQPAESSFYRWKEALALSAFALPFSAIQERWHTLKPIFHQACRLLLDGFKYSPLYSACLDFVTVCVTLFQAKMVLDDLSTEVSALTRLTELIQPIALEASKTLVILASKIPFSELWDNSFRRFVPMIAAPQQTVLLEGLSEFMPRVNLLRSLLELKLQVSASNYMLIHGVLCQLMGVMGCIDQQCWPLLSPIFDLAYGWLHLPLPPLDNDPRHAIAFWYISASFDKGLELDGALLEQLKFSLPRELDLVGTFEASSDRFGLLMDHVCACTYDNQVFWGLRNLDLEDPLSIGTALEDTTRIYSLFAAASTPRSIFQSISQHLSPRADLFVIMQLFSAPRSSFFHPQVVDRLLPLMSAIHAYEARLDFSRVLVPVENDRGLARHFQAYKDAVDKYLNCGFFCTNFLPIFLHPLDMQRYPWDFRAVFWGELLQGLSIYTLQGFVPPGGGILDNFLYPIETSYVVLDLMARALVSCAVTFGVTPFLFLIASHHLRYALKDVNDFPQDGRLALLRAQLESVIDFKSEENTKLN